MKTYLNFILEQTENDIFNNRQFHIRIDLHSELKSVLEIFTKFNVLWSSGSAANSLKIEFYLPLYIYYNYKKSGRLHFSKLKNPFIPLLSVEDFMNMIRNIHKKKKTNREIDPYDEEDWGWE